MITLRSINSLFNRLTLGSGGCWNFAGARTTSGYGKIMVERRAQSASRVMWMLLHGPIPEGTYICHTCDNRLCCNPAHLYAGTPHTNMLDAHARGRRPTGGAHRGEANHNAKLTAQQVANIRSRYAKGGISQSALAAEYGVTQGHISDIVRGKKFLSVAH